MMYNRFFSFGCSWTNWFWPTWADIIARDLDIEYQNWGRPGSGNQAIQSRFVEANNYYKFTENDLVIIQWSGWNREDRYLDGWKLGGNIFNNVYYDKKYLKRYWSFDNDIIKNSVILQTTSNAYSHLINYQFSFDMPFKKRNIDNTEYDDWNNKEYTTDKTTEIIQKYYKNVPNIDVPKINNSKFKLNCIDTHPDVKAHMDIVEEYVYPSIFKKNKVKNTTKEFFYSYYEDLSSILSLKDSWEDMHRKSYEINKKYNLILGEYIGL